MGYKYIKDGKVKSGDLLDDRSPVMVEAKSELATLSEKMDTIPGMIAFTAGYKDMWQLAADGTWEPIVESE